MEPGRDQSDNHYQPAMVEDMDVPCFFSACTNDIDMVRYNIEDQFYKKKTFGGKENAFHRKAGVRA
jgi:hypothetical protein